MEKIDTLERVQQESDINRVFAMIELAESMKESNANQYLLQMTNVFRILRNSYSTCPRNDFLIYSMYKIFKSVIEEYKEQKYTDENVKPLVKCALQAIGNFANSGNLEKIELWNTLFPSYIEFLLQWNDLVITNLVKFVIYSCLLDEQVALTLEKGYLITLSRYMLKDIATNEGCSEFSLYIIQNFLRRHNYLKEIYSSIDIKLRLVLLDIIFHAIEENRKSREAGKKEMHLDDSNLTQIGIMLDIYLKRISANNFIYSEALDTQVVVKLLVIISELTTQETSKWRSMWNKELLVQIIATLKSLHLLEKACSTESANEPKDGQNSNQVSDTPVLSLKRYLVRIIANLVYRNRSAQDLARDNDCVPLIMDLCHIDKNNPFLLEWCIFATRNLLENNDDNQAVVRSMSKHGVIADQQLLDRMGMKIEGDKVVFKDR